jgi:hypothetical protein
VDAPAKSWYRPLSQDERRMLGERPRPLLTKGRAIGLGLVACLVGVALVVVVVRVRSGSGDMAELAMLGVLVSTILLLGAMWVVRDRLFPSHGPTGARSAFDLTGGVAGVERLRAIDAMEVEEDEDLGVGYFLRLDDDRVLFLKGQYLQELTFPAMEFDLSRGPNSGVVLGIACLGPYLLPTRTIPPFTRSEYREGRVPEDGQMIEASWEDVLAECAEWASERRVSSVRR